MEQKDKSYIENWEKHQDWESKLQQSETDTILRKLQIAREYGEYVDTPRGKMHSSILLPKSGGLDHLKPSKYFKKNEHHLDKDEDILSK